MSDFRVPYQAAETEFTEKRSRFIGHLLPVETEEQAREFIARMKKKYYDARHNCWCYLIGRDVLRYGDDGEPQGTAGQPMLNVFQRENVTNVVCVVTRYFGGILLGTGGLVRAYTAAASGALQNAELVSMRLVVDCRLRVPYAQFEQAQRIIAAAGAKPEEPVFDDAVTLLWRMPAGEEGPLCAKLTELTRGSAEVTVSAAMYAPF